MRVLKVLVICALAVFNVFNVLGSTISEDCNVKFNGQNQTLTVSNELRRPVLRLVSRSDKNILRKPALEVEATAYSHTGNRTSSGTWPSAGRTIAVDPETIPVGSIVNIKGLGRRVAEDIIPRESVNKGAAVDIFMENNDKCLEWGRRKVQLTIEKCP